MQQIKDAGTLDRQFPHAQLIYNIRKIYRHLQADSGYARKNPYERSARIAHPTFPKDPCADNPVERTFSNMITKEILKKLKDKYLKFFISGQLSWTTFKHLIQILFRAGLDINQKSRRYQFFYAVNFAEHFADGHEKEVANICNLLIMNVDPEGHDPTTFGL